MQQAAIPPVLVEEAHKRFEIPREQVSTLKERALHPFRRGASDTLQALRGVSFAVGQGEFFGIVGRNGSGKSTLLKCLAGIYGLDGGRIYINGRMSTFIELGVGFNPDLPARDNALLNATMLGLSPREARRRLHSVIDFAELGEFVDLKIKNYSSGMLVRLAFSVMIHVDAEILLIDEVLAVGDAAFQQKCYEEFERIRSSGATVLLVTHDMSAVQRFCDRALLLEHGRAVELGDPEHVGNRYLELNFSEQARAEEETAAKADEAAAQAEETAAAREESAARVERTGIAAANAGSEQTAVPDEQVDAEVEGTRESALPATAARRDTDTTGAANDRSPDSAKRYGDGRAEIREAWFEDEHGERAEVLHTGRACAFAARVLFYDDVDDPLFGVVLHNSRRVNVLGATNQWTNEHTGIHHAGDQLVFRIGFDNFLAPDRYYATPAVAHRGMGAAWIDRRERFVDVVVTGIIATDATVLIPFKFAIDGEDSIAVARER